jgi:DNA-binding MarR family transcriptional regulator
MATPADEVILICLPCRNDVMRAILAVVQATAIPKAPPSSAAAVAQALYATSFTLSQRHARDLFQLLHEMELSVTQYKMLHLLSQQADEELSVKALGDKLALSLPTASRAVEDLHRRGYAERRECPEDRRVKRVRIADAGRRALNELHARNIAALTEFIATLTTTERRDLAAALAPVLARLEVRPTPEGPRP